jgi:hypothetical protein
MAESLLTELSSQFDILSERYIELEAAYSDALAQLNSRALQTHPNTSTISTRSAVTLSTPRKPVNEYSLKTHREKHSGLRLPHPESTLAVRRLHNELQIETAKRKKAENEVFHLQQVINKLKENSKKSLQPSRLATPRSSRPPGEPQSSRTTARPASLVNVLSDQLDISIETVRTYVKRICHKLHVRSKVEAIIKYRD